MTVHRRPPSDVGLAVPRAPIVRLPSGRSTRPAARPPTTGNARRYAEEPSMNTAAIRDKVAIVGMGCCKFGENWDQAPADMIVDAAYEAYADAGIDEPQRRIEAVFCGAQYPSRGTAEVADALKLYDRPVSMVVNYCATGTDAFRYGVFAVACGMYDTVLVVGFDKPKDRGVSGPSVAVTGVRGLPATPAGWFSHVAARYFETFGAGREDLARIAVKNHHNGTLAPKSMLKREITVEEALGARMISWPFGLYDCAAQSDGAAAAILTRRDLAKGHRDDFVLVRAVAIALAPDPKEAPDFDFLRWQPTRAAPRPACRSRAGWPSSRRHSARGRRRDRARRRGGTGGDGGVPCFRDRRGRDQHRRRPDPAVRRDHDGRAVADAGDGLGARGVRRRGRVSRRRAGPVARRRPRDAMAHGDAQLAAAARDHPGLRVPAGTVATRGRDDLLGRAGRRCARRSCELGSRGLHAVRRLRGLRPLLRQGAGRGPGAGDAGRPQPRAGRDRCLHGPGVPLLRHADSGQRCEPGGRADRRRAMRHRLPRAVRHAPAGRRAAPDRLLRRVARLRCDGLRSGVYVPAGRADLPRRAERRLPHAGAVLLRRRRQPPLPWAMRHGAAHAIRAARQGARQDRHRQCA